MPGIDIAMHRNGEKLALVADVCMTLFAVEQRSEGCVKVVGRG
jgi:hypothetical protein